MTGKKQWEIEYNGDRAVDCPYCEVDRPEHRCRNCYGDMDKETCWKLGGFCSEECQKFIKEELPQKRKRKEELGIKCKCDEPTCAKCLGMNCQDKNCPTHTTENKKAWRKGWEEANKRPFPHPENY